ncbi:MAG TPA: hypothetical protein VLX09_02550 [Stellaceae bacterium]|nr:hypothetical protein [Stellaceae bacterium]
MNWDRIAGNWKRQFSIAKERWSELTERDWTVIRGDRKRLVARLRARYGLAKEEAERQVSEFVDQSDEARQESGAKPRVH